MGKFGRFVLKQAEPILGLKDEFERFQTHVLQASDEERDTRLNEMKHDHQNLHEFTGLTGSLLATAAAATLVHPKLGDVHWFVGALWTAVLIISLVTAFSSCAYYSRINGLRSETQRLQFYAGIWGSKIHNWVEHAKNKPAHHVGVGDYGVGAVNFWMYTPCLLLSLALSLYMIALVLFWLLGWLGPLEGAEKQERIDSRNTFFVAVAALAIPTILIAVSVYMLRENEAVVEIMMGEPAAQDGDENALTLDIGA